MRLKLLVAIALLPLAACGKQASAPVTEGVTDAMIASAPEGEWLTYGRDYGEQRFSPLTKISDQNVGELGLAWSHDLETARGQEATPLMHDGVLYVSTAWSMVKAFDAKTGELKWSYDPKVPRDTLVRACCDAVNRGVALYGDKVYVGTLDGRLVALEQKTGKVVFEQTVVPNQKDYTITGAPRVAKGKILIGSGGSEYKARGYLAAYDAQTGKELWKFHTVPGNPADGFENKAMEEAAKTWGNSKWWELGGGGTVWDSITYDPATNLVYFGTGNAEPWNPAANGREGLDAFAKALRAGTPYDVIFIDVMMPAMDGHQALEAMRHLEHEQHVGPTDAAKVIMVSAADDSRNVYRAFFQGQAMSFLPKPFTCDAVLAELRKFDIIDQPAPQRSTA